MTKNLQTIFDKYKQDPSISMKSRSWFEQQAKLLANKRVDKNKLFTQQRVVSKIVPGKLYMFFYDPKYKDELPYYDRFPLVFPYGFTPQDGMMGLNMHYLPYYLRVQLMTRLMQFSSNKAFDENTKIRYSWELIKGASKFRYAAPCIKHYLKEHIVSRFIEIPASDWHTAMMLPVETFVGSSKNQVWRNSVK